MMPGFLKETTVLKVAIRNSLLFFNRRLFSSGATHLTPAPVSIAKVCPVEFSRLIHRIKKDDVDLIRLSFNRFRPEKDFSESYALAVQYGYKNTAPLNNDEKLLTSVRIKDLCKSLKNNTSVKELEFNDNELGDDAIQEIASMLEINRTIKLLNLSRNHITMSGINSLAKMLAINTTLRTLYVGNIGLNLERLQQLLAGVKNSRSLTELYLYGNYEIRTKDAMEIIANLLQHKTDISSLGLNYIPFNTDALRVLLNAVEQYQELVWLGLYSSNRLEDSQLVRKIYYVICKNNDRKMISLFPADITQYSISNSISLRPWI